MKAAYDWVVRSWLWKVVRSRISEKQEGLKFLMGRIEDLYSSTFAFITGDELDAKFVCSSGLRQGGVESPPLINVWRDTILKEYRRKCLEKDIGFDVDYAIHSFASTSDEARKLGLNGKYTVTKICDADGIVIFANNATSLGEATQILQKLMSAYGMTICSTKTKTMVMSPTLTEDNYPGSVVSLENTKKFRYLGTTICRNEPKTGSSEISARIASARFKVTDLKPVLKNPHVPMNIKKLYMESMVRSRLCFGCQSWVLKREDMDRLENWYRQQLRLLIIPGGFKRKGHGLAMLFKILLQLSQGRLTFTQFYFISF